MLGVSRLRLVSSEAVTWCLPVVGLHLVLLGSIDVYRRVISGGMMMMMMMMMMTMTMMIMGVRVPQDSLQDLVGSPKDAHGARR